MKQRQHLLLIEHDQELARQILCHFKNEYRIDHVCSGAHALRWANERPYVAIILAIRLPDINGLEVCRRLRRHNNNAPIIITSVETAHDVRIEAFRSGANDFIVKPYSLDELSIRLRVRIHKTDSLMTPKIVTKHLILDTVNRCCEREGRIITLRAKEYAIMECLVHAAGQTVSRDALIRYAWDGDDNTWLATVNVHIKNLRDKIDRPFSHPLIKTVHGCGYSLDTGKLLVK